MTSAGESQSLLNTNIFPNPAANTVTVSQYASERFEVKFFNALGETIYSGYYSGNETTIDISSFPKGIYFITITAGAKISTQKIIKE